MDIRTKLVFALVSVALGSMLAFGAFMYSDADRRLRDASVNQLRGLAESRGDALAETYRAWSERVLLIASRTQLRLSLRELERTADPQARARITRILEDARDAVTSVASLTVYDSAGRHVAGVGEASDTAVVAPETIESSAALGGPQFVGVAFAAGERPVLRFLTPLVLDGARIGSLVVVFTGQDLLELVSDYTGLGQTGEVLVVMRDGNAALTLHPVRHREEAGHRPIRIDAPNDPSFRALDGEERVWTGGLVDYRGEPVWAATRYLPETGWGLVVKFDADEGRSSVLEFRSHMADLALSIAAFAILIAVLLGVRVANPIHDLAAAADRIRKGDLEARASVVREDEIGHLSRTFNEMADELEEQMTLLHEYRKFFEVSLDMLCIAGTDGYFKRTNPAFRQVLGWDDEQLLGKPFYDLVHPDDVEATKQEIAKLARGIPTISFVNRFRRSDGEYTYLRWTSYPEPETRLLYAVARPLADPTRP